MTESRRQSLRCQIQTQFRRRLYSYRSHSLRSRGSVEESQQNVGPLYLLETTAGSPLAQFAQGNHQLQAFSRRLMAIFGSPQARSQSNVTTNMMSGRRETRAKCAMRPHRPKQEQCEETVSSETDRRWSVDTDFANFSASCNSFRLPGPKKLKADFSKLGIYPRNFKRQELLWASMKTSGLRF